MKKISIIATFFIATVFIGTIARADIVLYQPNIIGNTNPDSLGWNWEVSTFQTNLSHSAWYAHSGATAAPNADTTDWDDGFILGSVALMTRTSTGNPFRLTNGILWTDDFSVTDQDVQKLSEIRFQQNNEVDTVIPRVAMRVGGSWYASVSTYESAGTTDTTLSASTLDTINWYSLSFVASSELVLDTGSSVAFSALSGDVDAVGLYYDTLQANRVRLQEFYVAAIPEPATLGLLAGALTVLLGVRRLIL